MRFVFSSIIILSLLSGCSSISSKPGPPSSHQKEPPQPITVQDVSLLDEAQIAAIQEKTAALYHAGYLDHPIELKEPLTPVHVFHTSHAIVVQLLEKKHYEVCLSFIFWLQNSLFQTPTSHSFELAKVIALFRQTPNTPLLIENLSSLSLDIHHTPFEETAFLLERELAVLVRSGNTKLAFQLLDTIFEVYGPAEIIFLAVQNLFTQTQLRATVLLEIPETYKTDAMVGLIAAEQILAKYDQLQFTQASHWAREFLKKFPSHFYVPQIQTLLEHTKSKVHWEKLSIAIALPLTGPFSQAGQSILEGILFGLSMFDPQHETTWPFELFLLDTHENGAALETNLNHLIQQESIFMIIGPYLAQNHRVVAPIARNHKIPLLSLAPVNPSDDPSQGSTSTHSSSIIYLRPSLAHQLQFMTYFIHNYIHEVQTIGMIYPDNPFGYFQAEALSQALASTDKKVVVAEMYTPGSEKTYKNTVQKLLGIFDLFDRKEEMKLLTDEYKNKHGTLPTQDQVTLPPIHDFQVMYLPAPIRDASVLIPLFKYFDSTKFIILGSNLWNTEEMIVRTRPYLQNVILFDYYVDSDPHPAFQALKQTFQAHFSSTLDKDSFLGILLSEVISKSLSHIAHLPEMTQSDFLKQIQSVTGQTVLGQSWHISDIGIFHLDPIPLIFANKKFSRFSEEMIAKFQETVFPIEKFEESKAL